MAQKFVRDRLTWLLYILLAFYAYFLNSFGPITPFLKDELQLSYTASSLHFTAFATGIVAIGLGGNLLIERLGRWRSLWIGALGLGIGALLLITGRMPVITIGASLIMGLIGSLILAVVPSALADQHGPWGAAAISEANVTASLLSALAPLLVGWSAMLAGSWRLAMGISALVLVSMPILFRKTNRAHESGGQYEQETTRGRLPGLYWLFWTALVLAVSVEFCMVFWSADYMETWLGVAKASAAQAVSLFLAAMILGRLAGSRLAGRLSTHRLVRGSILVAFAGFLVFWQSRSALLSMAGLFITGLGVANLYPFILTLAIGSAYGHTTEASARATLASGTAILALPLILGRLADAVGIQPAYGVVALLLVSAFLVVQFTARRYPAQYVGLN